ncbi:HdeD family acid-resistance protein [Bilifractor sp. LCP19S3_H10]|uniref:HdeD family acid-resistance protein n=1 Tax=Bilifractor sp. LCP19S3_H10 TaxID=3438736 RepID=UPI003F90A5AF
MFRNLGENIKKKLLAVNIWSLILLIVGIFLLVRPESTLFVICRLLGVAMIVIGALLIASYINMRGEPVAAGALAGGVILAAFGIFILARPDVIAAFAGILFAVILISYACGQFVEMSTLRTFHDDRWYLCLIGGIVTLILGVVFLFHPMRLTSVLVQVAGAAMIYAAICGFVFHKRTADFASEVHDAAEEFRRAEDEFEDEMTGRPHYDENGQEIIDGTATEEDVDDRK